MSNYSERSEQQSGYVSSDTEDSTLYLTPSPVLKFASGPDNCQQQGEGESPNSRDQSLKTKYKKNWMNVQMNTISKESKGTKIQDTVFGARAVDINSNSVFHDSNARLLPGTDNKATTASRTNELYKKHGAASRRLKETSQHGRASPPSVQFTEVRPTLSRTVSESPVEDFNHHAVPNVKRRRSDPSVSRTNRHCGVNRKTKPVSLIRRVSPLQLLNKVTTTSNTKAVGALSPRLAKRLLGGPHRAGGSDPTINTAHECPENKFGPLGEGYDFPSQIHYLAEDIEKLNIHQYEGTRKIKQGVEVGAITPRDGETRQAHFKYGDVKLQKLMEDILRAHLLALTDYRPASCDRTSRNICKVISNFLSSMKTSTHAQSKFACLVYIGAVRDHGIHTASRALWNPDEDSFAAASFRNEFVFGFAVVIATPID